MALLDLQQPFGRASTPRFLVPPSPPVLIHSGDFPHYLPPSPTLMGSPSPPNIYMSKYRYEYAFQHSFNRHLLAARPWEHSSEQDGQGPCFHGAHLRRVTISKSDPRKCQTVLEELGIFSTGCPVMSWNWPKFTCALGMSLDPTSSASAHWPSP